MADVPRVSVALSVHNGGDYVRHAVRSVLDQTMGDLELVVVDDASTDKTRDVIRSFSDDRIRLVRNDEQRGLAGSHNRGLSLCRAPLVARMDHDDVCEPTRLAEQLAYLEERPSLAGCGTLTTEIDRDGNVIAEPRGEPGSGEPAYLRWWMCLGNAVWHPTSLMRREWLDRVGGYGHGAPFAEDYDLFSRIMRSGGELAEVPRRLLRYRVHATNTTQVRRAEQRRDAEAVRAAHIAWLLGGPADADASELMMRTLSFQPAPDWDVAGDRVGAMLRLIRRIRRAAGRDATPEAAAAMDRTLARHLLARGEAALRAHPTTSLRMGRYLARTPGHRKVGLNLAWRATRCLAGRRRSAAATPSRAARLKDNAPA